MEFSLLKERCFFAFWLHTSFAFAPIFVWQKLLLNFSKAEKKKTAKETTTTKMLAR